MFVYLVVVLCAYGIFMHSAEGTMNPADGLSATQLIAYHGYPFEIHTVTTADGYKLTMHRIPRGINCGTHCGVTPILVMHGILSSSADFVNMDPSKSIAYLLADAGYDVWLGNARGNTYSTPASAATNGSYWKFSWHEIGIYDLPAKIDYILAATGQTSLFYVGHSQGTTAFFVMTSMKPAYNAKVRMMAALAPVAFCPNMKSKMFRLLADNLLLADWITLMLGLNEFSPHSDLMAQIGESLCQDQSPYLGMCSNYYFLTMGWDSQQLNQSVLQVIYSNSPAGSSTRQLLHYGQIIKSGKFAQYDYGTIQNMVKYKQATPPNYDLTKVTTPVALYYGLNDQIAVPQDVQFTATKLPHVVKTYQVPYAMFMHVDFVWAIDVVPLVYQDVFATMSSY